MGIYGLGNAFNLRFRPRAQMGFRSGGCCRGPIFTGGNSYSSTTNITIKNGPSGFWGFMTGLFGGLFGGGMGMMGMSPYGMLNQMQSPKTQGNDDKDAKTKELEKQIEEANKKNKELEAEIEKLKQKPTTENQRASSSVQSEHETPQGVRDGYTAAKATDIKNGEELTVQDEIGNTQKISGNIEVSNDKADGDFPKTITIKSNASGNSYTYTFEGLTSSGQALYKSTSAKQQVYVAEFKDGKLLLNQREGVAETDQTGTADITTQSANASGESDSAKGVKQNKSNNTSTVDKSKTKDGKASLNSMEEENAAKKLGGRRTYGKGVYYDENKKMHFRLEKQKDGSYKRVDMPNVTQVNKDGSWNVKKADGTTETREVVKGSGKQTVKLSKNGHRQYSVTVNGKTFTANASGVRFSDQVDAKNAKEKLQEQLRAQGYTNITIE